MALTTQQKIDELRDALASGALSVRTTTNGVTKEVKYRSYAEMKNALADLEAQLAAETSVRRPTVGLGYFTRG